MACKELNTVVDDHVIYVRQWPASIALQNLSEALSVMGPSFASFIEGNYELHDIVRMLASDESAKLTPLLKRFVSAARVEGKEVNEVTFNSVYNGELLRIFKIFAIVAELNYKDFFEQGLLLSPQEQDTQHSEQQLSTQEIE